MVDHHPDPSACSELGRFVIIVLCLGQMLATCSETSNVVPAGTGWPSGLRWAAGEHPGRLALALTLTAWAAFRGPQGPLDGSNSTSVGPSSAPEPSEQAPRGL